MIPNRLVFVCLSPMAFSLVAYLAVRSATEVNQPEEVLLLCDELPSGPWWDKARPYISEVRRGTPPATVGTAPLLHPAHRADVLRLHELTEHGGIYLDLDVLSVRPLTPLLGEQLVLGREWQEDGSEVLCNGVILAEPGTRFGREWLAGYDPATSRWGGFRSRGQDVWWNEYSCRYPAWLATQLPESVTLAPYDAFHWPTWIPRHLKELFLGNGERYPNAYCHHLWATSSREQYLDRLTPEYIRTVDTNFTLMARRYFQD